MKCKNNSFVTGTILLVPFVPFSCKFTLYQPNKPNKSGQIQLAPKRHTETRPLRGLLQGRSIYQRSPKFQTTILHTVSQLYGSGWVTLSPLVLGQDRFISTTPVFAVKVLMSGNCIPIIPFYHRTTRRILNKISHTS